MTKEHWFDTWNKLLTHAAPRRGVLGAVAALTFGQRLGAADAAAKNGGKRGKKKKGKKPKKPKPPKDPQAPDDCATTWPGKRNKGNRNHCRFIRGQCSIGTPREFCIVKGHKPDGKATNVAVCCEEVEQCCRDLCCPPGIPCCGGICCGGEDSSLECCGGTCFDTTFNPTHCGTCGNRCDAGQICVRGQCERSCGAGSCPDGLSCCPSAENGCCQTFQTCCPGAGCKALLGDRDNCNACGHACPLGQSCINGVCGCREGFKFCGDECDVCDKCIREEWECCGPTSGCGPGHHCCGFGFQKFCSAQPCP